MRRNLVVIPIALLLCAPSAALAQPDYRTALAFSAAGPGGTPRDWSGGPAGTIFFDSVAARSAPYAGRIERDSSSATRSSNLGLSVPARFAGDSVELRGWLRTEDVKGTAGLWIRLDGPSAMLKVDNMRERALAGTTDWSEYRVRLPLDRLAQTIVVGAYLTGTGKVWVDDLELLIDGQPFDAAAPRELTGIEKDREFDGGSRVAATTASAVQTANLALLGKVWGFVKYHHPKVTSGEVNWDYELFRVMPAVLEATDGVGGRTAISQWLARLGDPPPCSPCATLSDSAVLLPPNDWIRDASMGAELRGQLERIHRNRSTSMAQHYVGFVPGVRNPDFAREDSYQAMSAAPDAGFRLLALFRFWNIIQYWFPYRDIIGENWDSVLAEFVPLVMGATDRDAYTLAMIRLSARVNDTHANLWQSLNVRPPRGTAQLPVTIRFVEGKPVVSGYTHPQLGPASGLQRGDVIERLGDSSIASLITAWHPYYSASNQPTRLRDIGRAMTTGEPGPVKVVVRRGSRTLELAPARVPAQNLQLGRVGVHDLPGEAFQMLSADVAYLKLSGIRNADIQDYMRRMAAAKVLVVDIRNYPSEFVVFNLGGRLVRRQTPFAKFSVGVPSNPGAFVMTPPQMLQPIQPAFDGKVVVLVDETSLSQAEYTAMALRAAPNTIIVGSTTAGADGNVSPVPLPGGLSSMITGIGVFYPDGRPTQRIGIVPDLEVRPTIPGIRDGKDEVLEAGVKKALGKEFRLQRP